MKTETLLLLGLGGAAAYTLLRKKPAANGNGVEGGVGPGPGRRGARGRLPTGLHLRAGGRPGVPAPAADPIETCDNLTTEDAGRLGAAAKEAVALFPGGWNTITEAQEKAHLAANYALARLCPSLPLAEQFYKVESYAETYGPDWERTYNAAYLGAYSELTGVGLYGGL